MLQLISHNPKPKYETFYEENYKRVLFYIQKKIDNIEDAEDLASEVFLYCFTHYEEYNPDKSSIITWLYMIVNSRIKNYYRDHKIHVDLDSLSGLLQDESIDLDSGIFIEQLHNSLMKAIYKLPERQQNIVLMRYFEEKSSDEIAKIMNLSPGNVRVLLSRALDTLERYCGRILEGV